jgi:hypothetical protein
VASVQRELRERAEGIIAGTAGAIGYRVASGRFSLTGEATDDGRRERYVEVEMRARRPLGGYNSPLCGQGLYITDLVVRVHYIVGEGEAAFEGLGAESGGSEVETVEDRAADDAQVLRAALGYQPSWSGVSPHGHRPRRARPSPGRGRVHPRRGRDSRRDDLYDAAAHTG